MLDFLEKKVLTSALSDVKFSIIAWLSVLLCFQAIVLVATILFFVHN